MYYKLGIWSDDSSFAFICGGTAEDVREQVQKNKELCARMPFLPLILVTLIKEGKDVRTKLANGDNILFNVEDLNHEG